MALTMLLAASLPLVAVMTITLVRSTNEVHALTLESAQGNLKAEAEKLSGYFAARLAEISAYAEMPLIRGLSWERIEQFLQAELERHDGIYEKLFVGLAGEGRYYTTAGGNSAYGGLASFDDNDPQAKLKSIAKREYWQKMVGANDKSEPVKYVSGPMISYTTGVRQVVVGSTILSEDGRVLGMVGGALPWDEIDARIKETHEDLLLSFKHAAKFCLMSANGIYMYHWDPERIIHLERNSRGEFILNEIGEKVAVRRKITEEKNPDLARAGCDILAGREGMAFFTDEQTGDEMVMVYAPVNSADYSLAMVIPKSEIVASVANLRNMLIVTTLVSIVFVIVASWYLAQRISKPIAALSVAARQLGSGNRYAELEPVGHDEMADLTKTFNDMSSALREREQALRDSEQRLRLILDSVQTGIIVVDADTRLISDVNPAVLQMLRVDREQIVGHPCSDFICTSSDGFCPVIDGIEEINAQEGTLLAADGREIPVLKTVTLTMMNGRRRLLESLVDISDLKQAEDELKHKMEEERESKRRLQVIVSDASGRERRMVELKQEVNDLLLALGKESKYEAPQKVAEMDSVFTDSSRS